jgi:Na+/melibiose symporter-like transporter
LKKSTKQKDQTQTIELDPVRLTTFSLLKISVYGFAISALWNCLHSIILPLTVLKHTGDSSKNTVLGIVTFFGLVLAMFVQPAAGSMSDRSHFRWGRRRPYILMGTIVVLLSLPGIAFNRGILLVVFAYCIIQLGGNVAQSAYQGFIPDLVPMKFHGRASGMKGLMEIFGSVGLMYPVGILMDRYARTGSQAWLSGALGVMALTLILALFFTSIGVKEKSIIKGAGGRLADFWKIFRIDTANNRDFVLFLVSRFLFFMGFTPLQTFALYFLSDSLDLSNPAINTAHFAAAAGVGMLVAVYPSGRISDRWGRKPLHYLSGFLGIAGVFCLFIFRHNYSGVIISSAMIGFAYGSFISVNWALGTALAGKNESARYMGLANLTAAGAAAASRLIGPLIDVFNNIKAGYGYGVLLGICIVALLGATIIITRIQNMEKRSA